ncbi:hybrid sensor histidine kinase/response regulator transcription factor [Mucilaginibacter sp. L196]|uniref:hybrid sensor histidine kinase/response regulator transcription factor n=1 Tax=Mucilaginibacter sp. L196 TaxID=1641870 RepID=UPI00131DF48C|nr:hybrid sensor histidine kinase/response regulator transcription factor [Mucilaginibacter sp. L196]
MRKVFVIGILLLLRWSPSFGQLSFDHLTVANGLSQSTVLSICKDSRGYMWFGTRDRLNQYDARSFKIFNHDYRNPGSISCSDYVFSIFEDREQNLWIGTVKGLNRYQREKDKFEELLHDPANAASITDNNIYYIFQDSQGALWIGTNNGLNVLSSSTSRRFTHIFRYSNGHQGLTDNQIYAIYEDHLHNIWIGGAEGLTKIERKNGKLNFTRFHSTSYKPDSLQGNEVRTITEDKQLRLWIGTETGGLNLYHPETSTFSHFKHDPFNGNSLSNNDVRKIMLDRQGQLWIGTINGLNILDPETLKFTHFVHDAESRNSLSDNSIKSIYQDNYGSIWVGTTYGGVNVMHADNIPFKVYQHNDFKNSISGNIVSAIIAGPKKSLWIGTEGYGLNYFDEITGVFKQYKNIASNKSSLTTNFVKTVYNDRENNLWVGLHQGGLELFDPASEKFKHFRHNKGDINSISSDIVSSLLEDSYGRFWVGTSEGLDIFDKKSQRFRNYLKDANKPFILTHASVRCVYEDSRHNLWVGTTTGLNLLSPGSDKFKRFAANERKPDSLKVGYINCIKEDSDGNLWIGSFHGGLSRYIAATGAFQTYGIEQGLPSDNVLNIQQGDQHSLWISTDNGLSRFDLATKKFRTFTVKDGLPTNEFNYNSSFKDAGNNLYFGTYNGLVTFNPKQITQNHIPPVIQFTDLRLFNKSVKIGQENDLLKEDISLTKEIVFKYNQNVFSVDFTALSFDKPDRNRFMYKLEGFENNWNRVNIPSATYTNLPAGEYDLLVRGSNNDGIWGSSKSLHIVILPPWWKTWWAYGIYTIIFFTTLYFVIRFFRRQARLERDLYYEQLNHERQQEIYQLKLDFFTKISHEIRTPLSLILAPIEKMLIQERNNPQIGHQLNYVKRNTDRLMRLVNELLDFRKIESGFMKLDVAEYDLVAFCQSVFDSFIELALSKNIVFRFSPPPTPVYLYFDAGQLEKVLYNLITNAFKFTPDNGIIELSIFPKSDVVEILVTDNGIGISKEVQTRIFENFYQNKQSSSSPGWGIGLALAKNIVDLHKGLISVQSEVALENNPGKTEFIITLLNGRNHFSDDQLSHPIKPNVDAIEIGAIEVIAFSTQTDSDPIAEKQVILLVEDNSDLRGFVKAALCSTYQIFESENGLDGWQLAQKIIPDIIISDVAMPVMDGFELCSRIKIDERTNHIPVVLLTARADQPNHLNGLTNGADVYITKPFSMEVLELNIRNLLASRQAMQQKFSRQITLMPKNREIDSPDEQFLNKTMQIIECNLENPDFDVVMLVDKIGMSQTVLYRKVKALTDMTITDFIKSIRLKQAASMLTQNKLTVAEVAYSVGFNDRKYFSKEFKKQFGQTPSGYVTNALLARS